MDKRPIKIGDVYRQLVDHLAVGFDDHDFYAGDCWIVGEILDDGSPFSIKMIHMNGEIRYQIRDRFYTSPAIYELVE